MKRLVPLFRLPLLPVWLSSFVLLAPVYLTLRALFWGTPLLQFIPWWAYAWRTLLSSHLPLWNPDLGMGAPLLANYQSALFYPFHWVYFLLYLLGGVRLMAWGQAPLVALHLAWAGTGMAFVVRRLGLGTLAQAVAGLAYGLSGYLVSRSGFLSINAAAAWLPWVLLCLTPAPGERHISPRRSLALAACLALQLLAGHAQTTWYTLLLAGLWATYWALARRSSAAALDRPSDEIGNSAAPASPPEDSGIAATPDRPPNLQSTIYILQSILPLLFALLLAVGIAAAQLFPTAEYLAQSQRAAAVDYDFALNYSFWPWRLLSLFVPDMFGNPAWGDYWGYGNYWEDAIYVGMLPFLAALGLLLGGAFRWLRSQFRRSEQSKISPDRTGASNLKSTLPDSFPLFLFILFALALLLALGKNTPVYPWLYRHVPTFAMFQAPARWMLWAEVALALLAAVGVERWRRPTGRALYWTRLGTMGAFAVALGAGLAWFGLREINLTFIRATALAGLWGLGIGALSLVAPPDENRPPEENEKPPRLFPAWPWVVTAWLALDLLVAGWGLNPGAALSLYDPAPGADEMRGLLASKRLFVPDVHEYMLKYERFLLFETFDPGEDWRNLRAIMLANANLLDGVASANNFDPLTPGRYATWLELLHDAAPRTNWRMLDMMAVGAVEIVDKDLPMGVRVQPFRSAGRARWVPCAWPAPDEAATWQQVASGEADYRQDVILEAPGLPVYARCEPPEPELANAQPTIAIETNGPNHITVRMTAPADGWLVLSDTWYPGWRAWLDGVAAQIFPANGMFRAVFVPAGVHEVRFSYRPLSFYAGLALSLVSCILFAWLWLRRGHVDRI